MKILGIRNLISPRVWRQKISERRLAKLQRIADEADAFILKNHPELVGRRQAVEEFLKAPKKPYEIKEKDVPDFRYLLSTPIEVLLGKCDDNLPKIKALYGDYGLAKYAELTPAKIVDETRNQNPNTILETGYISGQSFSFSFNEYMLINKYIGFQELNDRFGACGNAIYDAYRNLGFTKTGFYSFQLSSFGKDGLHLDNLCRKLL